MESAKVVKRDGGKSVTVSWGSEESDEESHYD